MLIQKRASQRLTFLSFGLIALIWLVGLTSDRAQSQSGTGTTSATAQRAMLIVLEENESQTFSTNWRQLSEIMQTYPLESLVPSEHLQLVTAIRDVLVVVGKPFNVPVTTFLNAATREARRSLLPMFIQALTLVEKQIQLPAAGCFKGVLDSLRQRGLVWGDDPFSAFRNAHGEAAMADCLRSMAQPYYHRVEVLTDQQATFSNFRDRVRALNGQGYTTDMLVDLHGCGTPQGANSTLNNKACGDVRLVFAGGAATANDIRAIRRTPVEARQETTPNLSQLQNINPVQVQQVTLGSRMNINAVYQVSCWGSNFNEPWTSIGARAANGARELNYFVLLSPFVFMDQFTRGQKTLQEAALVAYRAERTLVNGLPMPINLDLRPSVEAFLKLLPLDANGKNAARNSVGVACPGQKYENCRIAFDIGARYAATINQLLGAIHGHGGRAINAAASSQRMQLGDLSVRRAGM